MATISNIYIDQGSAFSNTITVTGADGVALNLTGYTVAAQMRKSYGSSTAYTFTTAVASASEGKVRISFTSSETDNIPGGRYLYDVEVTSLVGSKTRVIEGIVIVTPQITKI